MTPAKIAALALLVTLMFHTGLQIDRERLAQVIKDYGLLGRALLANFIIVPLLGVLFVRLFRVDDLIATGILLMAISPGVPFLVLSGGRKKGGSLSLAAALAFLMPILSVITVPLTAAWVLPDSGRLSAQSVIVSLVVFQLLPFFVGMLVNARLPAFAAKLMRPFGIIVLAAIVVLLGLLAVPIVTSIGTVYGSHGMYAMLCIVVLSLVAGWALGGKTREYRHTLGVGTALRNVGLAAVVATTTFHDRDVMASVMTYLLIQFVIVTIAGTFFSKIGKDAPAA